MIRGFELDRLVGVVRIFVGTNELAVSVVDVFEGNQLGVRHACSVERGYYLAAILRALGREFRGYLIVLVADRDHLAGGLVVNLELEGVFGAGNEFFVRVAYRVDQFGVLGGRERLVTVFAGESGL